MSARKSIRLSTLFRTTSAHCGSWRSSQLSAFLTANTKASDEFVYKLLKTVHQSKKELVAMTKALGTFNPKVMTFAVGGSQGPVKYHAGAIKYLKEVGQWPPVK